VFCSGGWLATNLTNLQTHIKDLHNFFAVDWHEKLLFAKPQCRPILKNSKVFLLVKKTWQQGFHPKLKSPLILICLW